MREVSEIENTNVFEPGHNERLDNARIEQILNELYADDEEEINNLLDDNNFSLYDENDDWEFDNRLIDSSIVDSATEASVRPVLVNGINCAAHTVQLAVKSAISRLSIEHSNVISLATKVVKFLRKENTRNEARDRGFKLKVPSIDTPTRWSSTYMMVIVLSFFYLITKCSFYFLMF